MGEVLSTSKIWRCPNCGSTLEKHMDKARLLLEAGAEVTGNVTCGICGARYSMQDVYSGKYDVPTENPPDLILIVCDHNLENRDVFIDSFFQNIRISFGPSTAIAVQPHTNAKEFDKIFPYAIAYGLNSLRRRSLDLIDDRIRYQQFEVDQGPMKIGGYVFLMYGKK